MTDVLHPAPNKKIQLYEHSQRDPGMWLLMIGAGLILAAGFGLRGEHRWVPDRGLGYGLGVIGLGAMVGLLAYSLRKRLPLMRSWGRVQTWFRIHMFLGLAGPVAILLHCNFSLGSLNATIALMSALLVSGSGVVGRLLYVRIHAGLFGERLTLIELRSGIADQRTELRAEGSTTGRGGDAIDRFESGVLASRGLVGSTLQLFRLRRARSRALAEVTEGLARRGGEVEAARTTKDVDSYLRAVSRVAVFTASERWFSLWHVIHLPLCVLLFLAAATHVIAVSVY